MLKIRTTGELRAFLADLLALVAENKIERERAQLMVKIAGRINESFYAEVLIKRTALVNRPDDHVPGKLLLSAPKA